MFFKNYTRKQWRRDAKDSIDVRRIPIRINPVQDDRYLSEGYSALPKKGYTAMFREFFASENRGAA